MTICETIKDDIGNKPNIFIPITTFVLIILAKANIWIAPIFSIFIIGKVTLDIVLLSATITSIATLVIQPIDTAAINCQIDDLKQIKNNDGSNLNNNGYNNKNHLAQNIS